MNILHLENKALCLKEFIFPDFFLTKIIVIFSFHLQSGLQNRHWNPVATLVSHKRLSCPRSQLIWNTPSKEVCKPCVCDLLWHTTRLKFVGFGGFLLMFKPHLHCCKKNCLFFPISSSGATANVGWEKVKLAARMLLPLLLLKPRERTAWELAFPDAGVGGLP